MNSLESLINCHDTPLRSAPNETFIRALRLAGAYHNIPLGVSIQKKWITRLLWKELSPLPVIVFAANFRLQDLLSNALYRLLIDIASKEDDVAAYCRSAPQATLPLNGNHRTQLLAGFHSLGTYWKQTKVLPPLFEPSPECQAHDRCLLAWRIRWVFACRHQTATPEVDVLGRLVFVESALKEDEVLACSMGSACWASALASIPRRRGEVSRSLHDHFDLG